MSNEFVMVPRELLERALHRGLTGFLSVAEVDGLRAALGAQSHDEPVAVYVGVTERDSAEGFVDLLVDSIELGTKLYPRPAQGERLRNCLRTEVEAGDSWKREAQELRTDLETMRRKNNEYCDEVISLRAELERFKEANQRLSTSNTNRRKENARLRLNISEMNEDARIRDGQIAERDALLSDISKRHWSGVDFDLPTDLVTRIAALSASAEPSAPKCKYCGDTGQIMVGRSGDANDGNAPIMEPCEDCDGSGSSGGQMHSNGIDAPEYEPFKCDTCSGFGVVGNILNAETCTDCTPSAPVERDERAEFVVPDGYALVPKSMLLDKGVIGAINFHCGDTDQEEGSQFGQYTDGRLWVGYVLDDNGQKVHGLHIATDEYQEEGSTTLVEFPEARAALERDVKATLRSLLEGVEVSIDVSTCDEDAGNRLFGTVSEVMDHPPGKHGVILLVHDQEPNFKPIELTDEQIIEAMRESLNHADGGYVVDTAPQDVVKAGRALLARTALERRS